MLFDLKINQASIKDAFQKATDLTKNKDFLGHSFHQLVEFYEPKVKINDKREYEPWLFVLLNQENTMKMTKNIETFKTILSKTIVQDFGFKGCIIDYIKNENKAHYYNGKLN